jgi:hypothetical protein
MLPMKKTLLIFYLLLLATCLYAQTNVFPSTGSVGIGTMTPNAALHVENGTALISKNILGGLGGQISISNGYGNQNGAVGLNLNNGGAVSWIKGVVTGANTNTGSAMVFGVPSNTSDGAEIMRITGDGYLGIGTSSPTAKLDVNGNVIVRTDNMARLGGQLTISNGYGNQNGAVRLNLNNGGAVSWIKGIVTGANTDSGSAIVFGVPSVTTDGTEVMRITGNGYLGIGTSSPTAKLDVDGNVIVRTDNLARLGGQLTISNGYGNQNGAVRLNLNNGGAVSWIKGIVTGANTDTGSAIVFGVPSVTSDGMEVMRITGNGYLGIGTTTPDSRLAVNGMIHCQAVKVDLMNWPDYVFKPTYKLPLLNEVKNYIDKNHRLPGMPSEKEVTKNGLDVGEILRVQTQKIEELTLYLIEKDRQVRDLQNEMKQFKIQQRLDQHSRKRSLR